MLSTDRDQRRTRIAGRAPLALRDARLASFAVVQSPGVGAVELLTVVIMSVCAVSLSA
jgi:hypothetical protein